MAINSVLSATSPFAPPAVRAVSVRDPNSLAQQIPALAVPSTTVTLGASAVAPLLYNPAGLLRALGDADKAGALPTGTSSSTGSAGLQGNLETVLGLNSDTGFLGTTNPAGSLGNLSGESGRALGSVLATGDGNGQALEQLLARALASSSSGQDRTRSAVTVVNATGVLRSGSAEQALKALDSLRSANLELAASAIDAGSGNTQGLNGAALPAVAVGNGDNQVFNRNLSARLEQSVADIESTRQRRRATARAGADDLLLTGVSLLTGTTDSAVINTEPALLADQIAREPAVPADALARLVPNLPLHASASAADRSPTEEVAAELKSFATGSPPVSPVRNEPAAPEAQATRSTLESVTEARAPAATTAAAATPSVTREPRYAEIVASMSMGAAVYRFQTNVATGVPPGAVSPLRTVLQVRSTPAANRVS